MTNYYDILHVPKNATTAEIKKAFRQRAKQLHPDIASSSGGEGGDSNAHQMRKVLVAYKTLSDRDRRFEYDRAYNRFIGTERFSYRNFLMQRSDPESQSKLIFFDLLHLEEESALAIWHKLGGLDFPLQHYLDREDWMDCGYLLAEELAKRRHVYEAFVLLVSLIREERRLPYFRHFLSEVENFLKGLVRLHLRHSVDGETYLHCMSVLLDLGFPPQFQSRIARSIAHHHKKENKLDKAKN